MRGSQNGRTRGIAIAAVAVFGGLVTKVTMPGGAPRGLLNPFLTSCWAIQPRQDKELISKLVYTAVVAEVLGSEKSPASTPARVRCDAPWLQFACSTGRNLR
jgi:hypothetical protein